MTPISRGQYWDAPPRPIRTRATDYQHRPPTDAAWADFITHYNERLHPARGMLHGLLLGAVVWVLLIVTVVTLHGRGAL